MTILVWVKKKYYREHVSIGSIETSGMASRVGSLNG